ncbi:MAG: TIGR00725 family protein [Euryarchaeota archaeon RBG_19FT_COMBO_56_21]|nr:MAG: TIGR00725 family protein [Euryarchaeota archaeon RBG_19FT_COMBO_56_21]
MAFKIIGVVGSSKAEPDVLKLAEEVGSEIAKRGAAVVCGGMTGVMEAVCRGARKEGGLTIGIIPSDKKGDANPFVQIPIVTGMGMGRNVMLVKTADVIIAVGGEFGTLSEIAHALNIGKRVIGLHTWKLERAHDKRIPNLIEVDTAKDAVDLALQSIPAQV